MDPFGSDHDTIKLATIHIIHAIQRLYAQSGPKVAPKWSQSGLEVEPKSPNQSEKRPNTKPQAVPEVLDRIQKFGDSEIRRFRDSEIRRFRDSEIQRLRDSEFRNPASPYPF